MKVAWFSAGVSSFVAAYLSKPDKIIYIDIDDQHPDSMRFVLDCEALLNTPIEIIKSPYGSVENACRAFGYINGVGGAKCTSVLKKRVRKEWEQAHKGTALTYVWGFDCTEQARADRLNQTMPYAEHQFPLIDAMMTKDDAHGFAKRLGIKRPYMYDLGYSNNNCIGCVKGGMWYWNKIRVDFPEVFTRRAKLEREIGHSCINGVYLDELPKTAGRMSREILEECGIACEIQLATGEERASVGQEADQWTD